MQEVLLNCQKRMNKPFIHSEEDQELALMPAREEKLAFFPHRILVEAGKLYKCIPVTEIAYLKAERDHTWIYTINEESFLSALGIGAIAERLDPRLFLRIHRSYIVNINYIKIMYRDISKTFIGLQNDVELSVGRSYYPQLRQYIF